MLEQFIAKLLATLGAGDQLIAASGPTACILFGMIGANLCAQVFKYPLSVLLVKPAAFDWAVRMLTIVSGTVIAHSLGDSLNWAWSTIAGLSAWGFYHLSLGIIRRRWPWLETNYLVGSIDPPPTAQQAAALRAVDKEGGNSGV